jgi:hypothetical protein
MKLLNAVRSRILVAVLLGLGLTAGLSSVAKADVCYYDANGLTYRGEILATYNSVPSAALVHWETINGAIVIGREERIPFFDLTNCGGQYIQFFPYAFHPYVVGYHLNYAFRVYDRGYFPAGSHRYHTRGPVGHGPVVHPAPPRHEEPRRPTPGPARRTPPVAHGNDHGHHFE